MAKEAKSTRGVSLSASEGSRPRSAVVKFSSSIAARRPLRATFIFGISTVLAIAATGCGGSKKAAKTACSTQECLVASVSRGVVEVRDSRDGMGTGFIIDKQKRLVLTAAHVVAGSSALKVRYKDQTTSAQLLGENPCQDVALLKVSDLPPNTRALTFGDSSTIKSGQRITGLGFPISLQNPRQNEKLVANPGSLTADGTVEATPEPDLPTYPAVIQHQAPTTYGDSGGPIVNRLGKVIGMEALGNPDATSQGYAIASNHLTSLLPDLKAGKFTAYVGMLVEPPSFRSNQEIKDMGWSYQPFGKTGVAVYGVDTGSPADNHNFVFGDYIRFINGSTVNSEQDFCDILQSNEGKIIKITGYDLVNTGKVYEAKMRVR